MRRQILILALSLVFMCPFTAVKSEQLTLAENGKSNYSIVISTKASPSEIHGAQELQMFLKLISSTDIPIQSDNESIDGPMILVGNSTMLQRIAGDIKFSDLGDEGFIMRTIGPNLILAGGQLRGSMYAVYSFLEEVLGCRWYTSDCSKIPRMTTMSIDSLNETQKPAFEYREPYWRDAFDKDWAARNKCNSSSADLDVVRGGKVGWPGVHTFYPLMPPSQYFENHPEWYSILSNRKRQWEYGQLCLMNPEVQKVMSARVKERMAHDPERKIFDVSQNDWHVACDCPPCRATDDKEGSHAGTLLYFVNAVAERTSKEYPDKYVMTLSYTYTENTPKYVKPGKNVIIRLCNMNHITGCDAHPLLRCDRNKKFVENLKAWSKIADRIYIWDYVTDFANYLQPFPIWMTNQEDLRFFKQYGVDGMFEQGCANTTGAGCSELMAYVESKLLWNPDRNVREIVDDFIAGYYGPAVKPMKEFYQLLEDRVMKDWCHFTLYSPVTVNLFSTDLLTRSNEILDRAALAAANDVPVTRRVEEAKLWIRFVELAQPVPRVMESGFFKPASNAPVYANLRNLDKFVENCRNHGIIELSEGRQYHRRLLYMKANLGTHKVLTLENPLVKVEFIPGLGGKIYQITDKRTGKGVLRIASSSEPTFPIAGGMIESPNDAENCSYHLETTPVGQKISFQSIIYLRSVPDAMILNREIFLPLDKSEIEFNSTLEALINVSNPVKISPSAEFTLGDWSLVSSGFVGSSGKFEIAPLPADKDERGRFAKSYRTKEISSGKWCLIDKNANIAIITEYNPGEVEVCSIGGDTESKSLSMGLSGIQKPLKTGEKLHISYKFIIADPEKIN